MTMITVIGRGHGGQGQHAEGNLAERVGVKHAGSAGVDAMGNVRVGGKGEIETLGWSSG